MKIKLHVRHPDSEVFVARLKAFGFTVRDKGGECVEAERGGRASVIDLEEKAVRESNDPIDRWLLSLALEEGRESESCETYFLRLANDHVRPAQIILSAALGSERKLQIVHGAVGSEPERHDVATFDELMDALPFLAPSNAVGYHLARGRVFARYEEIRPKAWEDVGITDAGTIVEYERHRVRPNDIANAAKSGIVGMDRIVATFGIPADDEWVEVRERREPDKPSDSN